MEQRMDKYVFFLGGHDAEMEEIKKILQAHNQEFYDHNLSWGAKLSSYLQEIEELSKDKLPVFIELVLNCQYPHSALVIDHHNTEAGQDQKTSLEQVADMLGITLNRWQKLISENDRGHIKALKKYGANWEEIVQIREMDRRAQGVTEEDEDLARQTIQNHIEELDKEAVIFSSLTNKTSAIVDRVYDQYKHIFIYTPKGELNYFGKGDMVERLVATFKRKKEDNPSIYYWYGGNLPEHGFFGASHPIEKNEVKRVLQSST